MADRRALPPEHGPPAGARLRLPPPNHVLGPDAGHVRICPRARSGYPRKHQRKKRHKHVRREGDDAGRRAGAAAPTAALALQCRGSAHLKSGASPAWAKLPIIASEICLCTLAGTAGDTMNDHSVLSAAGGRGATGAEGAGLRRRQAGGLERTRSRRGGEGGRRGAQPVPSRCVCAFFLVPRYECAGVLQQDG